MNACIGDSAIMLRERQRHSTGTLRIQISHKLSVCSIPEYIVSTAKQRIRRWWGLFPQNKVLKQLFELFTGTAEA